MCKRKVRASEGEITLFTNDDGGDDAISDTYHMDAEEATVMTTPTSLRIPPFGGTPGENLNGSFRRFDRAVRWVVYPRYPTCE